MKRYHFKAGDGVVRLQLHHGPAFDDVRLVKQVNDDVVVEIPLDVAELQGLLPVLAAIEKVRTTPAAPAPAAGKVVAGALALAIAVVVAVGDAGCLEGGVESAAPFAVTYTDRSAPGYFGADAGGVPTPCAQPPAEQLELEQPRPGCTHLDHGGGCGLNLLCGRGAALWVPRFRWDDHGEGGRGVLHLEGPGCAGDYDVEIRRAP